MSKLIIVPYIPQNGYGSSLYATDCGVACIAMFLSYVNKLKGMTVNQLAKTTSLSISDTGLNCYQLESLGIENNLMIYVHSYTTDEHMKREIDENRPFIALIDDAYIPNRLAKNFIGNHFIVVCGYNDDSWYVCDPFTWNPYYEYGHNMQIKKTDLRKAIDVVQSHGQCIFMDGDYMTSQDTINTIQNLITDSKEKINIAQLQLNKLSALTTSLPNPTTDTVYTKYVTESGLRMRSLPNNTSTPSPYGTLVKGTMLKVVSSGIDPWWKIVNTNPKWDNYFVSGLYLSDKPT